MGDAACMRAHVQSNADAMASFDYRYGHYFGGAARGGMLRRVLFCYLCCVKNDVLLLL